MVKAGSFVCRLHWGMCGVRSKVTTFLLTAIILYLSHDPQGAHPSPSQEHRATPRRNGLCLGLYITDWGLQRERGSFMQHSHSPTATIDPRCQFHDAEDFSLK